MVDCPYCNAEVHVESENIRDEFRETCGVCDREFIVYLDWSLSSEPLPAKVGVGVCARHGWRGDSEQECPRCAGERAGHEIVSDKNCDQCGGTGMLCENGADEFCPYCDSTGIQTDKHSIPMNETERESMHKALRASVTQVTEQNRSEK